MNVITTRNYPGLTNHKVHIPGTDVTVCMGVRDSDPLTYVYSLWRGEGDGEELISCDVITFPGRITPEQMARIAYLVDVEYAS